MNQEVFRRCSCCGCGHPMADSAHINLIATNLKANWKYPVAGNVLTGSFGRAVAVVCDDCIDEQVPINRVIELQGEKVVYHETKEAA